MTRGPSDRREVLVSFDAGSSDRGASEILDALAKRNIRTTIFVTGEFVRRYPEIARRIAADGHEVGNHTDTHPHLTTYASDGRQTTRLGVDRAFVAGELARTARLYRDATGQTMAPLWRAPFGEHNAEIRRWAAEQGYWHVGWTGGRTGLDGLDWITDPSARGYRSAERLLSRLVQHAENGGIVLLHLGSDRDRARELEDRRAPRRALRAGGSGSRALRSFWSARATTPRASRHSGAVRPRALRESGNSDALKIAFGTDGWRGVIADTCTFSEIRRIAAATARWYAAGTGRAIRGASSSATTRDSSRPSWRARRPRSSPPPESTCC